MTGHKFKNLQWRDGRPRWSPGKSTRELGFKSFDLKDDAGNWLPFKEACIAASKMNAQVAKKRNEAGPIRGGRRMRLADEQVLSFATYVYFLWVGERVKIGYSRDPLRRIDGMQTGLPLQFDRLAIVQGTVADEQRLHKRFNAQREKGEWFRITPRLNEVLFEMLEKGTTDIP